MNKSLSVFLFTIFFSFVPFSAFAEKGISNYDEIIKIIDKEKLYEHQDWLNLLHFYGKRSVVDKKSVFFLSVGGHKNPRAEMVETIKSLYDETLKNDEHAACSFPARLQFLQKHLPLNIKKQKCSNYEEFKYKVPMDKVLIVFASENNSVPTSIMGHIFIKLSGTSGGKLREHAFSYFATDVDTTSLKFYYDVMVTSIDGMYVLTPYRVKIEDYLYLEQRPLWEINLILNEEQKDYLHKHMWELKEKNVRYSFVFHNCGTASVNLLKIVYPEAELSGYKIFETPIDYVLRFNKLEKVNDVALIPSPEYYLKMIRGNYDLIDIYQAGTASREKQDLSEKQKYLANLIHNLKESEGMMKNDIYPEVEEEKVEIKRDVKNVLYSKPSSQIYAGYRNHNKDALEVEFMPLYQSFYDVSKAQYDDFETKILSVNMIYDDKFYVNRFDAISVRSIVDASMSWNMISKYGRISFENALGEDGFNLRPVAEGGLGYAYALFDQKIKPYFLPKIGYRYDNFNNFYFVPEVGIIIKPLEDVKLVVSYENYYDSKDNNRGFSEKTSASLAYLLPQNSTLYVEFNKYSGTKTNDDTEFSAGVGFSF